MMMKQSVLIADSGSTKTDWALDGQRFLTQGINPFHQDEATIRAILTDELLPQIPSAAVQHVQFYGSGVRPELESKMQALLKESFPEAIDIEAHGDLLGAARALCGNEEGIACILGTGANSCLYDGNRIIQNTPPMGYILGDEGSGAVLGVRFLNALYKNRLPQSIRQLFEQTLGMQLPQIIDRVYRQPMANRWLASLSTFIHTQLGEPTVEQLVIDNFSDFLRFNVAPYRRPDLPVSAVGSIAYFYHEQLQKAVESEGYVLGRVVRSPLDALVQMEQFR
jgi:N-acetylglucosamine kinase-like BadF-type ATPase